MPLHNNHLLQSFFRGRVGLVLFRLVRILCLVGLLGLFSISLGCIIDGPFSCVECGMLWDVQTSLPQPKIELSQELRFGVQKKSFFIVNKGDKDTLIGADIVGVDRQLFHTNIHGRGPIALDKGAKLPIEIFLKEHSPKTQSKPLSARLVLVFRSEQSIEVDVYTRGNSPPLVLDCKNHLHFAPTEIGKSQELRCHVHHTSTSSFSLEKITFHPALGDKKSFQLLLPNTLPMVMPGYQDIPSVLKFQFQPKKADTSYRGIFKIEGRFEGAQKSYQTEIVVTGKGFSKP